MEFAISERIIRLKDKMLKEPRFASFEQAKIITDTYKENEGLPRIMQRALSLKAALEKIEIKVEPEELIVGNRTAGVRAGVVFPESGCSWVEKELDTLERRPQDRFEVRKKDKVLFQTEILPYWQGKSMEDVLRREHGKSIDAIAKIVKINQKDHAQGHICPDCIQWLEKGPNGIKAEAGKKLEGAKPQQVAFYQSVILCMEGAQAFMRRYHELIMDRQNQSPLSEDEIQVAKNCLALSERPAQTFHEAVQSLWFLFVILQMESNASSFSPGRIDQILLPYYREDCKAGMLDQKRALEILECLWIKFNQIVYMRNANSAKYFAGFPIGFNIAVGGVDQAGEDWVNDLSFLCLQAQDHLRLPQPNLSVRLNPKTTDDFLKAAIRVVAKGGGMPQFFNDKAIIPSLEGLGISKADARNYAIVGCVELTTHGNNLGWSDAAMFNLNKALELVLTGGKCLLSGRQLMPSKGTLVDYKSFEDLEQALRETLDLYIEKMVEACAVVEKAHMDMLPSPFLSAVINDCLEKGLDVTAGGAHYNLSGIQMIQVANLADSLAALKELVFDHPKIGKQQLLEALWHDFKEDSIMKAMLLNRAPKYGNDIPWVDTLGVEWARYFREKLSTYRNHRGGKYHTGMYTVSAHVPMGENLGASPDGRVAQSPLADGGLSPVYGRDLEGPTAVLKSVSKIDKELTSNGGLLNMKFLPTFFETEENISKFALFLRTFVDLEIPHIQFNVIRQEDLIEAQKYPEKYRSLTVRVAGYTAYFTELATKLQNEIIERTNYEGC
ncbi:glycyl radical protein [Eubacterium barkeri]|uniref:Formate C-acetyltransferase n=1 Tax=Eubacterium barkeri TaxID=1528 RepID=A0A1H3JLQ9_EUBBA|nr:formate C-acetyltransferase/glycerol dehydratase family glycyl radical enzyme [Eubacterium barkeri]SDY40465.1 formate C-acetyltransferase [Eubacterium barkeri]